MLQTGNTAYISALTSMIYGLSAIHINAVGWIAGRADLLTGLFGSAAFLFLLKFQSSRINLKILFTIMCLLFAVLSKESAIVLPFIFSAYLLVNKNLDTKKKLLSSVVILFVVVCYLVLRNVVSGTVRTDTIALSTFFTNLRVLPETLTKFFFPIDINALPDFNPIKTVVGLIILLSLLIIPVAMKEINKQIYYAGLISFILLMIPGMFFRTMAFDGFYYWDCRSYLPLIVLVFPLSEILKNIRKNLEPKKVQTLGYVYVFILAFGTIYHLPKYSDGKTFWKSVIEDYPERYLSYIGLFNYNNYYKNFSEAEENLQSALEINPANAQYRTLQINFYKSEHQYEKAFESAQNGLKYSEENISLTQQLIKLADKTNNNSILVEFFFEEVRSKKYYLGLKELLMEEIDISLQNNNLLQYNFYKTLVEKTDSMIKN